MKKNKISLIWKYFMLVVLFYSCDFKKDNTNEVNNKIEAEVNDSLNICIFFNENSGAISTVIIKNKKSNLENIIGFHKDGTTPSLAGVKIDGLREGAYYTYYSSGSLNNKILYKQDEFDGDYISFSEEGIIKYKAFYENGIEKMVEINDTSSNIEIIEIK